MRNPSVRQTCCMTANRSTRPRPASTLRPMSTTAAPMPERAAQFRQRFAALEAEIGKVIVGQPDIVRGVLTCLFVGGHVLLEGVPGLGKTLLVRTLAAALDLSFNRVQFTPDLMPSDVTGT